MKTIQHTSTKNSRRRLVTSGLIAAVLTSVTVGIAQAQPYPSGADTNQANELHVRLDRQWGGSPAGVYSCGAHELRTHLEKQACGD